MDEHTVHTGDGGKKGRWPTWVFIVAAIILALGAGVAARVIMVRNQAADRKANTLPQKVDEVQNLRLEGDAAQAEKKIAEALNDSSTTSPERYMLYIQQGSVGEDAGNFQAAVDAYLKARAIKETYEIVQLLASAYERLGDKPKAIEYYNKAITLVPQNNPVRDEDIASLRAKIKALSEQQP